LGVTRARRDSMSILGWPGMSRFLAPEPGPNRPGAPAEQEFRFC
jgi:hypothetical protein